MLTVAWGDGVPAGSVSSGDCIMKVGVGLAKASRMRVVNGGKWEK